MVKNTVYLEHYGKIKQLKKDIIQFFDNLKHDEDMSMEEDLIEGALYKLNEALENADDIISYCARATQEGYLKESPYTSGRYVLGKHEFTCGCPVEICLWGKWRKGYVEYGEEYYFKGFGNPTFSQLMKSKVKVRIRL